MGAEVKAHDFALKSICSIHCFSATDEVLAKQFNKSRHFVLCLKGRNSKG